MRLGLGVGVPMPAGVGGVPSAFSPLDLSPVLWLDASDLSTITESGGSVSQWDDKSGNGVNVVQATAANQPTTGTRTINGLNTIDFDGVDWLRTASAQTVTAQPITMFVVSDVDSGNQDSFVDSRTASNRATFFVQTGVNVRLIAGVTLSVNGVGVLGTPHIFTAICDGASSEILLDAALYGSGNAGTNSFEPATIGSNYVNGYGLDGAIGEVVIVPTVDGADVAAMHTYLADKWGITL